MQEADLKDQTATELVEHEETALAPAGDGLLGLSPIALQADALQVIERQVQIHMAVNIAFIRLTEPGDWIASRVGDEVVCMPGGSATAKMARFLQLQIQGPDGEAQPLKERVHRGEVPGYRVRFRARSLVLGSLAGLPPMAVPWTAMETTRWADEDFTGRQVDATGKIVRRGGVGALNSDLSAAADRACQNRAIRLLTGLGRVPLELVARAFGKDPGVVLKGIQKGHGFGTAQERTAGRVAEEGVADKAKALWEEILRRVGGDLSAATDVLRQCTAYPAGTYKGGDKKGQTYNAFSGVDSWQRLTREKDLESAKRRLAAHETFGDNAQQQREREPGEDW